MPGVKKAVIPAGGFGTRMLPATKTIPKEMLPVVDKPAIQYIVEEALGSGIEDILIITARGKDATIRHFEEENIHYIRQKEPRGLGDAVLHAREFVGGEPFGVLLGDALVKGGYSKKADKAGVAKKEIPCLLELIDEHERSGASVVGMREVSRERVNNYGVVKSSEIDGDSVIIESIIEKPSVSEAPSNLATMGRYVFTPEIFDCLEETGLGVGGEHQLTDAIDGLSKREKVLAYKARGTRYDTGSLEGYLKTMVDFALDREDIGEELQSYLKSLFK